MKDLLLFSSKCDCPLDESTKIIYSQDKKYVKWGKDNMLPSVLYDMYINNSTLQSCIETYHTYISGGSVNFDRNVIIDGVSYTLTNTDDELKTIFSSCLYDYLIYGGFILNVIDNGFKYIKYEYLDINKMRTNDTETTFYFASKEWGAYTVKYINVQKFNLNKDNISGIYYFKNKRSKEIYPISLWVSSFESCLILNKIRDFHLNNLSNGYFTNLLVQFNNGVPTEAEKDAIEKQFKRKFSGVDGSLLLFSWANDSDHATTISRIDDDNMDEKFKDLEEMCRNNIFNSFRVAPQLVGYSVSTPLSKNEYVEAFDVLNQTVIKNCQNELIDAFSKCGLSLTIEPFVIQ